MEPTMTIAERAARREVIRTRLSEIQAEFGESDIPESVRSECETLFTEDDTHERAITADRELRERIASRFAQTGGGERVDGEHAGFVPPAASGQGGQNGQPAASRSTALVTGRTDASIYDVRAIRQRANSLEEAAGMYHENALHVLERATYPGSESRERAQQIVERLLNSVDDETGTLAQRIMMTGSQVYLRAWSKTMARLGPTGLSPEELAALEHGRALAVSTGSAGGFAVPFQLDPTVLLTSNGAINPLRQISRVETIVGKELDLVTSAGVTVSRSAEASAMSDNTPTLAQPTIKAERVTGFIPFSLEIEQDWAALQSQMMLLLADAKDVEESSSFTNGDGTGTNAGGIITTLAGGSAVTGVGAAGALAAGDLYAAEDAMAPRFRARASWMASKTTYNAYRQLFTQTASAAGDPWVRPSQGTPAELLGYPAYEDSDMVTTHANGDKVIVLGDFGRGFIIVDRLGMSTEIAPHLFDQATGRPTGQRGLISFWRNNSRVLIDNAFRLIVVPSS